MESSKISILKTFSWRILATLITMAIAWYITDEAKFAASIGILDALFKLFLYYFHERMWVRLRLIGSRTIAEQQATRNCK